MTRNSFRSTESKGRTDGPRERDRERATVGSPVGRFRFRAGKYLFGLLPTGARDVTLIHCL